MIVDDEIFAFKLSRQSISLTNFLIAALARLGHIQFWDSFFSRSFRHQFKIGAAYKCAKLDILSDEIILSCLKEHLQLVGREFGLGRHLMVFVPLRQENLNLDIEFHFQSGIEMRPEFLPAFGMVIEGYTSLSIHKICG